jgi:lysophospholipase L1-like esterase
MRRILLKLSLIMAGTLVGLTLGEVIVRAFHLGHTRTVFNYNNHLVKLRPHVGFMNYYENTNWVEINNLGFHDHDRQATNDNYRILFLGDSFVDGRQVDIESLFTTRLEKKFTAEGQKVETINGGVPGTGTAYQYLLWKEFFEPQIRIDHLALCVFVGNDLTDNNADLLAATDPTSDSTIFVDAQGNVFNRGTPPGRVKRIVNYVRDHSALANSSYENAYRLKRTLQADAADTDSANVSDRAGAQNVATAWEASEQGTIALIKRWKAELAAKKIAFDVVIIDRPGKVYNKYESDFVERLPAACAQDQIDCLRLKLSADPYETYSFDGIALGHFNYKGHELAAGELYDFLKSRHGVVLSRKN